MMTLYALRRRRCREAGGALAVVLVLVVICAALATSTVLGAVAAQKEARSMLAAERAFQYAEAGVDWAIAEIRENNGELPDSPNQTVTLDDGGTFTISLSTGDTNGLDDDGDTTIDEADEAVYVSMLSTGEADGVRRTLSVLMQQAVEVPELNASTLFNVDSPILDLNGSAFILNGNEHDLEGNEISGLPAKVALTSPAAKSVLEDQIDPKNYDQFVGADGSPSVGQADAVELDELVEQAKNAADYDLESGTHSNTTFGEPTSTGAVVVYADGDIHLSGGSTGAGLLAIDGDLKISGAFEWVGIVLVRGTVTLTGGGGTKRVIGAMVVGEEISSSSSSTTIKLAGTVDLNYSTEAINLAMLRVSTMQVVSWGEVANP